MSRFRRTLTLLSLASLLALPATGFAGDRSRGDRGDRSERRDRDDDSDSDRDTRRGRRDSSHDTYRSRSSRGGHGHRDHGHYSGRSRHRTRVVVRQPQVVVHQPRVVVRQPQVVVTGRIDSYPRRYIEPMYLGRDSFHAVMSDLDRARFEDDRLNIIRHVARNYTVSTGQVQAMVGVLRFSDSRLEALVTLHSRTRDRENWYQVYDLLTFASDRRELRRRCGY